MKPNLKKLTKELFLYLIIFVAIYTAFTLYRQPKMPANPTWQMTTLDGHSLDIQEMSQDKAVLLYFWGSWCHVCRTTSPKINDLSLNNQVVTVAVSSGDDKELTHYLNNKNYHFSTINDNDGTIFHTWQGQVTPSYVVIKNGQVVQSFVGIQPLWVLKARIAMADF